MTDAKDKQRFERIEAFLLDRMTADERRRFEDEVRARRDLHRRRVAAVAGHEDPTVTGHDHLGRKDVPVYDGTGELDAVSRGRVVVAGGFPRGVEVERATVHAVDERLEELGEAAFVRVIAFAL